MVRHQRELTAQMALSQERKRNVEMNDRERQMNRDLLRKVRSDKALLGKLTQRLEHGQTKFSRMRL